MAEGIEHRRRFAAIDQHGHIHLTSDVDKIALHVLDGQSEDQALHRVYFAVDYILEHVRCVLSLPCCANHHVLCRSLSYDQTPQAPKLIPFSKTSPAKAKVASSKQKSARPPLEHDSDIEILDGPPSKSVKQEPSALQEAILKWLRAYRNGYYDTHKIVIQIRSNAAMKSDPDDDEPKKSKGNGKRDGKSSNKKSKGKKKDDGKDKRCRPQAFTLLQEWIKIVNDINSIAETDDSAEPIARHKKISQIVVGLFLNRSHDWVTNCCRAQALLNQHGNDPAIKRLTRKLEKESLGVNKLLVVLRRAVAHPSKGVSVSGNDTSAQDEDYDKGEGRPSYVEVDGDDELLLLLLLLSSSSDSE